MDHELTHLLPIAFSTAAVIAACLVLITGQRLGPRTLRHALAPSLFLGAHGLVGLVLFTGRELGMARSHVGTIAATLDVASIALLAWMLVDAAGAVAQVRAELQASRLREREYERARRDYEILMRHRIANPLAVLGGGVRTLEELDGVLSAADRAQLLRAMAQAAEQVEHAALAPDPVAPEERGLAGRPCVRLAPARVPASA
jgi:hypothetical protein